jgi:CRISPR-associated endonuclease/helicase Cas3
MSRYAAGMRHEALSARIAAVRTAGLPDVDEALVMHLVASHHGRARPLLPAILDGAPVKVEIEDGVAFDSAETVDWDGPRRFAELNGRYGRWGLALLEAVVRMADIWCSVREERCDEPHT